MTDDLRDLVEPILADPPHVAPSLDKLRDRVDRRRRRRARTIGAVSVFAVVLVAAATILALPRDAELRVGGAGSTTVTTVAPPPPGTAPVPILLGVTPEAAPLGTPRTLSVHNASDETYFECGFRYDVHRWDGSAWQPVALLYVALASNAPDGAAISYTPFLAPYDDTPTEIQCLGGLSVAAGATASVPLNLGELADHAPGGTIPATPIGPLVPGVYELRSTAGALSSLPALGRFEITASDGPTVTAEPAPSTVVTVPGQTSATVGGITVESTIDVWPGDPLTPTGERLPDQVVIVDDHTLAVTWRGGCGEPADHVGVRMTADEVELRVSLGAFAGRDCHDTAIAPWVLTFDLGGGVGDRRVVARADTEVGAGTGTADEVVAPAWDHPADADPWNTDIRSGPVTYFSYQLVNEAEVDGQFEALYPQPLVDSDLWCDLYELRANGLEVLRARVEPSEDAGCGGGHVIAPEVGYTVFGAPEPRAARQP